MLNIVYAQESGGEVAPTAGAPFPMEIMIVVMFIAMYFLIFAPGRKRDKERKAMLAALAKNDRVITQGGICGTIVGISEKTVVLRVSDDDNVKMEFVRGAIVQVIPKDEQKS